MRVAILTHNAQAGDAIGNQVAEKVALFLDRGAHVRVIIEGGQRLHPAVRPHCDVLRQPATRADLWPFLSSADLIVVEYSQYYRLLDLLPLVAGGPRILFDYHGVTPPDLWEGPHREALELGVRQRGLVWCADAALVHSRFAHQELCGPTAFPAERVFTLDYPLNLAHFRPGSPRKDWRVRQGLRDASLLLFVGRLAPNKRVPVLVSALARLRDVSPSIHLMLIGDTTDVYELEARRCRQQAKQLGLADRVHFLGHVPDDQLVDAYRSADLFVMPSRHEGFCIPLIEAMACGLPVLAARAGASPETVAGAGLTFTVDDPDDLARQVRRVLGEPPLAEQLQRQGLLRAAGYERSAWRERFGQIVEELLERPPRPKREQVDVRPRIPSRAVSVGSESLLVPVVVANRGTRAVLSDGPGRMLLRCVVVDENGQRCALPTPDVPLPTLLIPGQQTAAMMRVPVPATAGAYEVALFAAPRSAHDRAPTAESEAVLTKEILPVAPAFRLIVNPAEKESGSGFATALQAAHRALAEAERTHHLPADYVDVTQGLLATCKRWIKAKLLGNFKQAYVDVLSRRQTAFNRQTLTALQELAESCASLDHTLQNLADQLAEVRRRFAALETRINQLEARESVRP